MDARASRFYPTTKGKAPVRLEFTSRTKKQAYERSGGKCEECTAELRGGFIEYHHVVEAYLGGDNSLGNCLCICRTCHKSITSSRAPVLAKVERNWRKDRGIRPRSRFAGSKDSNWKKTINHGWVRRDAVRGIPGATWPSEKEEQ